MRDGGLKVWVLTGDKVETAKNIGFSCNLINQDMKIFDILEQDNSIIDKIQHIKLMFKKFEKRNKNVKLAIVIHGKSLLILDKLDEAKYEFV